MSVSTISTIMEEQIEDTLVKVNVLMSQVSESMSAVSNVQQFLPVVSELLLKLQRVVSHQICADNVVSSENQELWWDSTTEMVTYSEDNINDCDLNDSQIS